MDVIELLLPELRKRDLFWDDYVVKGGTYRENITGQVGQKYPADDHPAATYHWKAGVESKDHIIPADPELEIKQEGVVSQETRKETGNSPKISLKRKGFANGTPGRRKSARVSS